MEYEEQINRLTSISIAKPLLPEVFIPWQESRKENERYMPEYLVSLFGMPEYDELSNEQKIDLGRHEVAQVMYSYSWSEALLCLFLSRYILTLSTNSTEYKFILRLLIEEYRHQEMFATAIDHLGCKPIPLSGFIRMIGVGSAKYMSVNNAFVSTIAIEIISDRYGEHIRKGEGLYPVMNKIAELHHIEESRHIRFTKVFLESRILNAGFVRCSIYSFVVMLNIIHMRALYVKQHIYERIGLKNSRTLYKKAKRNYEITFGEKCVEDIVPFVRSINGFNWLTKPAWRIFLKVKV